MLLSNLGFAMRPGWPHELPCLSHLDLATGLRDDWASGVCSRDVPPIGLRRRLPVAHPFAAPIQHDCSKLALCCLQHDLRALPII
jgi:hypothetical protein